MWASASFGKHAACVVHASALQSADMQPAPQLCSVAKQKGPKSSQMDLSAQKDTETILPPLRFLSPSAPSFQVAPSVRVLEPEPKNKHLAEDFYMQIL